MSRLRLPLKLLMGKIGKLKIDVPWSSLSSDPVIINIESVNIVVQPEGRNEWTKNMDSIHANAVLRTEFLDKLAASIYKDLTVSDT